MMEGEKCLVSSRNNEVKIWDEDIWNLSFGEIGSQFHERDEKYMIANPKN